MGVDITERRQMEMEFARPDRLDRIGEMAASIGHEIRNPMTTIRGFLQMVNERDDNERYREYYELMIEELDRANSIITEYLSMSRDKAGTPFKTTKENGTGLGLAVCYSIVHRHNANLEVETGQGGTVFAVRFKN